VNALLARYTHGPGIDEPVAMTRSGSTFFYHQDGLGTVTELTDSTGTMVKAYAYDAHGNILDQTGAVENPYTYTGREFDAETGLYYYRARHYDPNTGRFLQKDPIGLLGGDPTLYSYALNTPANAKDPYGLNTVTAGALAGAAVGGPPGAVVGAVVGLGIGIAGGIIISDIIDFEQKRKDRDKSRADSDVGAPNCPNPLCKLDKEIKLSEVRWSDRDHDGVPIPGLTRRQCEYKCPDGSRFSVLITNRLGCPKERPR
jgi:RHS repeat-associated protein